ncbi:hypothetical protein ACWEPL_21710 [Nonomuraea sp. NPDC004186]
MKLASAIQRGAASRRAGLVVLDEPVSGLHPSDLQRVVDALDVLPSRRRAPRPPASSGGTRRACRSWRRDLVRCPRPLVVIGWLLSAPSACNEVAYVTGATMSALRGWEP